MAVHTKMEVKVPHRSGNDKSFQNLLTTKVGTLTPILCDELIPNSKVHLRAAISASLPPLASDTFMRCDLKCEAFFVPSRILYGGFEAWMTGDQVYDSEESEYFSVCPPRAVVQMGGPAIADADANWLWYKPGTLLDYLNFKCVRVKSEAEGGPVGGRTRYINIFPLLAYHKIYDDWYRNTLVQSPVFNRPVNNITGYLTNIPFDCYSTTNTFNVDSLFPDGVALGSLRQRNFGLDYFTVAAPTPQRGAAPKITFATSGATGEISISAIRAANSLTQFAERNNLPGKRMQDYVRANYGADLSSGVAQRAIYLGSCDFPVYSKGISQTAEVTAGSTQNPFNSVGAQYGKAFAAGDSTLVEDFTANEPGYLMVLCSLVPKVTYSLGVDKMFERYTDGVDASPAEMPHPLLQNVGNEAINSTEISGDYSNTIFGWTERYASFKTKVDQLHGLLRDGQSLESFALQRTCLGAPYISDSSFLPIPTDFLDQVSAVNGDISKYGVWIDSFLDYKVSMPLEEYSVPSLQDPAYEHGRSVMVDIRGSKL